MSSIKGSNRLFLVSRLLFVLMMVFFVIGFAFQQFYKNSPKHALPIELITKTVQQKCHTADKEIRHISELLQREDIDGLKWLVFEKKPFSYFVFQDKELIFWSDNQYVATYMEAHQWRYNLLSKAHGLTKSHSVGSYQVIAYIPIKYNYPYENEELQNLFVKDIHLNKEVDIVLNETDMRNAIYSDRGAYLFSLENAGHPIFNEQISLLALFSFIVAFLISFYLLARLPYLIGRKKISNREYLIVSITLSMVVYLLLRFNIPSTFFSNTVFTPDLYSSNSILKTLTHLSFLSLFILSEVVLYTFYVKKEQKKREWHYIRQMATLMIPALFFVAIYLLLISLVFNSTTEQKITDVKDFSFITVWYHFLYLLWGVSFMLLYINTHRNVSQSSSHKEILWLDGAIVLLVSLLLFLLLKRYGGHAIITLIICYLALSIPLWRRGRVYSDKTLLAIWLFVFTFLFTGNAIQMNADKKFEQYNIIAENHFVSEHTETNRIAESLIPILSLSIQNDTILPKILQHSDSIVLANNYLNDIYFRGFWNKYEARLFKVDKGSPLQQEYEKIIETDGSDINKSLFYSIRRPNSELNFLGRFISKSASPFYIELYPKKNFKSFSFPNLLIETKPTIQSRLSLASATYQYRQLKSYNGTYNYPKNGDWIKPTGDPFFKQKVKDMTHYIYAPDTYTYYILTEKTSPSLLPYLLYLFYTYMAYVAICFFTIWLHQMLERKSVVRYRFISKYLYSFILLIIFGFVVIFVFTLNYMETKYKDQQLQNLKQTKSYIQSHLQENYYWIEYINKEVTQHIASDLQRLSYIYQTDIHVYDNDGNLIATSQPSLFSKKLISQKISPIPFFSQNENLDLYEKIGNLEYLTTYTDFYNGDFLQLGYIAIPLFFSKDRIDKDVENFLAIVVQIYLFIVILFIFLSLIIARRLSQPLTMLQDNLKEIRLGKSNKKISYKPNDEVRLLVTQYNQMVDELEKSTKRLIESERESAWKTMARQVAHEINNPLTPMKLTIQQLQRVKGMDREKFEEIFEQYTETLIEQIDNLTRTAATFSNFAKMPDTKLQEIDVSKKIKSVITLFRQIDPTVTIHYIEAEQEVQVLADREQFVQVLNNILKNAIQAIPKGQKGVITVRLEKQTENIAIYIQDNGKGILPENRHKMFQPNFTTKSTGMGLGLSISQSFVKNIGGNISFTTKEGAGTTFKITLPQHPKNQ